MSLQQEIITLYVLMERDYGGMFTSPFLPTGEGTISEAEAKEWVSKDKHNRTYHQIKVKIAGSTGEFNFQ